MSSEEMTRSEVYGRRRTRPRSQRFLAGGLGVVGLGAVAGVLLLSSGEADIGTPLPPASPAASSAVDDLSDGTDSTEDVVESLQTLPVTTTEIFLSRDPFDPVVPETVDAVETVDENGELTDPIDPDADPPLIVPGDPDAPACVGQEELVCNGQVVSLMDIARNIDDEPVAVIQVDTIIYEVVRGETFAENYQALLIDEGCMTLLYGDEGFRLCTGDVVLK